MSSQNPKETFEKLYSNEFSDELDKLEEGYPEEKRSVYIDHEVIREEYPDLAREIIYNPDDMFDAAKAALTSHPKTENVYDNFEDAHIRVKNLEGHTEVRELRSDHLNTFVSIKGVVRSTSEVKPKIQVSHYECLNCLEEMRIVQHDRHMVEANECSSCDTGGPLELRYEKSDFIDSQIVQVQESPEGLRGGETPEEINIPIEDDITGEVTPGDHVTVTGILRLEEKQEVKNESPTFDTYLEGKTIEPEDEKFDEMDISEDDIVEIEKEASHDDVYERLVGSMAPSIYGYTDEKLSIILQLFSGVTKHLPDGSRIRGKIHILIIGDPGTGKSKLLQYVRNIAPRAVYSSGKGSSSAGLTAAAVQKDLGDGTEWTLEAGTLVLADGGIAAIDELDKMSSDDRSALHEGLEQGEISIAKAGINATLKSRCALLAAANPKHGRFEEYDEVLSEQINLEPALISRFDLIFKVKDDPDPEKDSKMADSILGSNRIGQRTVKRTYEQSKKNNVDAASVTFDDLDKEDTDVVPTISNELLRKYIAHAQQVCYPEMTDSAQDKIRDFYVNLRSPDDDDSAAVPTTARKLEGMVRLSEASSRVRLSNTINETDVERAIRLVKESLKDVSFDPETGSFDADMIESGTSHTQRDRMNTVFNIIEELQQEDEYEEGVPLDTIIDEGQEVGLSKGKIEKTIQKYKKSGDIYDPTKSEKYRTL